MPPIVTSAEIERPAAEVLARMPAVHAASRAAAA
jgi:hypothetical protein